jgi:hypothetical protein
MKQKFLQLLKEAAGGKNIHMEHLEDSIFDHGRKGFKTALDYLHGLSHGMTGKGGKDFFVTTKYDGAPAVVFGRHPETGMFFVATKGAFNVTPKVNYSIDDVEDNYPDSPQLQAKLKAALEHLPKLGEMKGVYQGDLMFTPEDLQMRKIGNKEHVTFRPNTITYSSPLDSDESKKIMGSKLGIVVHTGYEGDSLANMKARFDPDLSHFKGHPDVYFKNARMHDEEDGTDMSEKDHFRTLQLLAGAMQHLETSGELMDHVSSSPEYAAHLKTYTNYNVRNGIPKGSAKGFHTYLRTRFEAERAKMKSEKGRARHEQQSKPVLQHVADNAEAYDSLFDAHSALGKAKLHLVDKFRRAKGLGTHLEDADTGELRPTHPEGYVAVRKKSGVGYKMVDREDFSRANFTLPKKWDTKKKEQEPQETVSESFIQKLNRINRSGGIL